MKNAALEKTFSLHTGVLSWFRSNACAIGAWASTAHVQEWGWWSQQKGGQSYATGRGEMDLDWLGLDECLRHILTSAPFSIIG